MIPVFILIAWQMEKMPILLMVGTVLFPETVSHSLGKIFTYWEVGYIFDLSSGH